MKRRRFTPEFKRTIVEQLLSEAARPAEICRRYNLASGQLYTWKKQYAEGHFDPEPSKEAELTARVAELERMLGKVTMENEFLKKAVRNSLKQTQKKDSSLPKNAPLSKAFKGGAS
jgi:transposase